MYLYEKKETTDRIRIKNGINIPYTSTKTVRYFECNNCKCIFTRDKNGILRGSDIHFCSSCPSPFLRSQLTHNIAVKKAQEQSEKITNGYKERYVGSSYPYRNTKWVREHIYVMENHIGKRIPKNMVVHHIDGVKLNNDLSNLMLMTVDEHNKCHGRIEKIVFELYKMGVVSFNRTTHEYYVDIDFRELLC